MKFGTQFQPSRCLLNIHIILTQCNEGWGTAEAWWGTTRTWTRINEISGTVATFFYPSGINQIRLFHKSSLLCLTLVIKSLFRCQPSSVGAVAQKIRWSILRIDQPIKHSEIGTGEMIGGIIDLRIITKFWNNQPQRCQEKRQNFGKSPVPHRLPAQTPVALRRLDRCKNPY